MIVKEIHDWLQKDCGQEIQPRSFGKKSAHAQEAHEAIRPTHINKLMPNRSSLHLLFAFL